MGSLIRLCFLRSGDLNDGSCSTARRALKTFRTGKEKKRPLTSGAFLITARTILLDHLNAFKLVAVLIL